MGTLNYRIDSEDKITEVNSEFWGFAEDNGASFGEEDVLGNSLFEFITDEATARIYEVLHHYVRTSDIPLRFPYRCDSPECRRSMEMKISPLSEENLRIESKLVREVRREDVTPFTFAGNALIGLQQSTLILFCSFCNRAALPGRPWTDLASLLEGAFGSLTAQPPAVACQPCRECVSRISESVKFSSQLFRASSRRFQADNRRFASIVHQTRQQLHEVSEKLSNP